MLLRARQFEFRFPRPALIMGVVNVTPDSFSDGGKFFKPEAAIEHALQLTQEGADIIDIGGESTRPSAEPVPEAEELRRVLPVIEALARRIQQPISIDTTKPAVARAALAAGASMVNDVATNREDEAMWRTVEEAGAGYVAMHMQGTPQTMQLNPHYEDIVAEVRAFFVDRLARLEAAGVAPEHVMLDVGIGFGKTLDHNLQLLAALGGFTSLGRPLMLGVSRKSFVSKLLGTAPGERLFATLAGTALAVESGVHIIRTHDVAATVQAVRMTEAILAARK
ncbi:MAG TPA: dihydropteroate synthase [Verrucomicrobiae bacterium]|nr:dihydropteroate synthase [Verrucomicrobiae bacterium]